MRSLLPNLRRSPAPGLCLGTNLSDFGAASKARARTETAPRAMLRWRREERGTGGDEEEAPPIETAFCIIDLIAFSPFDAGDRERGKNEQEALRGCGEEKTRKAQKWFLSRDRNTFFSLACSFVFQNLLSKPPLSNPFSPHLPRSRFFLAAVLCVILQTETAFLINIHSHHLPSFLSAPASVPWSSSAAATTVARTQAATCSRVCVCFCPAPPASPAAAPSACEII